MRTRIVIVLLALAAACSERTPPRFEPASIPGTESGDKIASAQNEGSVCRFQLTAAPKPLALLDFTSQNAGRTCAPDGKVILFVPLTGASCAAPAEFAVESTAVLGASEATDAFVRCFASAVLALPRRRVC